MKTAPKLLALTATMVLLLNTIAGPSQADDASPMDVLETLTSASLLKKSPAESLLKDIHAAPPATGESSNRIPDRSSKQLVLTTRTKETISVGLPFGHQDSAGRKVYGDAMSFDNKNGSTTVVLPKTDGSVQVATIIAGISAPTSFSYPLSLPAGGRALVSSVGLVLILDSKDQYAAAVAPPGPLTLKVSKFQRVSSYAGTGLCNRSII